MSEGLKGQDKLSYEERITEIVTNFAKTTGGIKAAAFIDEEGEVVGFYSEIDKNLLDSIGAATTENITKLKNELKQQGVMKEVQEMESVIEDIRVFTLKILNEYDYALCVICPIDGARAATIKGKFHNSVKSDIISELKEQGFLAK